MKLEKIPSKEENIKQQVKRENAMRRQERKK